jgi:integrase
MLTREELQLLLAAPMRRRNALAIRILLATAVRSAELYQAKWADVGLDGAQWHIPKSKTGAAMDIPLAPVVVDWFRELRTLAGSSAYVLPGHSRSRASAWRRYPSEQGHAARGHRPLAALCQARGAPLHAARPAQHRGSAAAVSAANGSEVGRRA